MGGAAMFCEHANECPSGGCSCDVDCYCFQEGSCGKRKLNSKVNMETSDRTEFGSSHGRVFQFYSWGELLRFLEDISKDTEFTGAVLYKDRNAIKVFTEHNLPWLGHSVNKHMGRELDT